MKGIRNYLSWGIGIVFLLTLIISCAVGPPPGSPQSGYSIHGFVGKTPTIPAMQENVVLINATTKQPVDMEKTSFLGKYTFSGVPPGLYIIQVADKQLQVFLKNKNVRQDIDLSAADGKMDYLSHHIKQAAESRGLGPPGDPELVRHFAGMWAAYSGTSGGGTLINYEFYPNGAFADASETSYSRQTTDSSFGALGTDSSTARWKVKGDKQQGQIVIFYPNGNKRTINYRVYSKGGRVYSREYMFNNRHFSKQKDY